MLTTIWQKFRWHTDGILITAEKFRVRTHHNALRFISVSHITVGLAHARPNKEFHYILQLLILCIVIGLTDNSVICMLSLRGLFFYCFTSHVYYFRLEIYSKTIIGFSFWFFPLEMYIIEQLLDSVFVICKIINVSVRVIILAFGPANNSYLDIDNFHSIIIHQRVLVVYLTLCDQGGGGALDINIA